MELKRPARLVLLALLAAVCTIAARGASEKELIGILESDATVQQKARACQQLAVVGGKDAVPALAGLLGHRELGGYARFGLQPIDDPSVDDALRDAMGRLEGRLLVGVVNSIGVRRDAKAVKGLQALVDDPAKGAAPEALMALGMIATGEAITTIRGVLAGGSPAMRAAAADAALVAAEHLLGAKRNAEAVGLHDAVRDANVPGHLRVAGAYGAMVSRGAAGIPLVVTALRSDDADMAGVALRAARELPGPEVSTALVAELEKGAPAVQARLIGVLVHRKDASAREAIESLAHSDDAAVRGAALTALGEIGDVSSTGALLKALRGEGVTEAVGSLKALGGEGVDEAILAGLDGADGAARVELIGILADRRCTDAVPALLRETASEDTNAARAAFKALGVLGGAKDLPAVIRSLLAAKSTAVAREAESAVIGMADGHADVIVATLESTASPASRVSLLRVLARMGGEGACAAVTRASADSDAAVRDACVRALASWPDACAVDALLEIVKRTKTEKHRVLALRGYVRLLGRGAAAQPGLAAARFAEAMSLAKTVDTRKAVLGALAHVPHRDALALAMSRANDKALRAEAELAAVTIARTIMGVESERVRAAADKLAASSNKRTAKAARGILVQLDRFADAIVAWRISGPYMQKGKMYHQLFDIVFEPEKPDANDVKWQSVAAGTHAKYPQVIDVRKALGGDQRVAYALTWVHSDKAQPVSLQMGTDDGVKAWLNGKLVHANNTARAAIPYTDKVNVALKKGWNPLLLKVTQNQIPWEFCARICGRDGKRLEGLRFDPYHEGEWRLPKGARKPSRRAAPRPAKASTPPPSMKGTPIFDGKTFAGWEGNLKWFRIEGGAVVGGTLKERIPNNEFLCTKKEYANFQLKLKLKLVANKGNAGIQVRSKRIPNHHEMIGYQADVSAAYWGALYDESRRRKMLARPDRATLKKAVKVNDWNEYVIRCEGKRIQLWLNGVQTVDYTEPDPKIPQTGIIGLQIHGGGPSEIWYKDIEIEVLP